MDTDVKDRIALLVGHIWELARATEPDLTGIGRVRMCELNVQQLVKEVVAAERERCAKVAEATEVQGDYFYNDNGSYWESDAEATRTAIVEAIRKEK